MELEEGMPRKIGLSVGVVLVFIVGMVGIGLQFNDNGLTETGGLALVAAMVLFIFAFAAVGLLLND
ncbi:MAG: hypothetical protein V5A31_13880 [Haloferacaceae archaeon]|jgi:hypothetical protein